MVRLSGPLALAFAAAAATCALTAATASWAYHTRFVKYNELVRTASQAFWRIVGGPPARVELARGLPL